MEREDNRIFLHACCGPCAEWPLLVLPKEGFDVTLFYYNPNIHPRFEWQRRLANLRKLGTLRGVEVVSEEAYEEQKWRNEEWIGKYESRCHMCYDIRMQKVAEEAKANGFSAFSTTLLVSIYQNHEEVAEAAERAADRVGVSFVYRDFRDGYRKGQDMAKEDGLYRQKYCGCILSLEESKFRDRIYAGFPDVSIDPGSAG
ncbi:MAG: epoxyqueuosine reductase QueH [Clostridiales bacterium]|nr:epoxyqueuosine reductase QueH [Clostridiales bacterium]